MPEQPPPMRLALVSRRYPPEIGGAELVMSYLANALAKAGADVTVFTSSPLADGAVLEDSSARQTSLRVERLTAPSTRLLGTFLYMKQLRSRLIEGKFDLIYGSMLKHDSYVAVGVCERLSIPVVLRPEGAGATGDLAWHAWGRFGRKIAKRCLTADALVAISPSIHSELLSAGYDPGRIHDLPNGVPIPEEGWSPRPDCGEQPRAVYVGRLSAEKNLVSLVEQWPRVRSSYPTATLILVGEGPERSRLAAEVDRLGLGDSIKMPGSSPDPASILRAADLFVLPSREEGMSIALLEAMALGIPIVASAIPGNMQLIDNGEQGLLAPLSTEHAFADAILAQWANPNQAILMGRRARQRVQELYSIDAVAQRHLTLFRHLINQVLTR